LIANDICLATKPFQRTTAIPELQAFTQSLVIVLLGLAIALANYFPALQAARTDPTIALRHE